jgi:hypothetical protein
VERESDDVDASYPWPILTKELPSDVQRRIYLVVELSLMKKWWTA